MYLKMKFRIKIKKINVLHSLKIILYHPPLIELHLCYSIIDSFYGSLNYNKYYTTKEHFKILTHLS